MIKVKAKALLIEFAERIGVNTHEFKTIDAYLDDPNRTIKFDDDDKQPTNTTCPDCGQRGTSYLADDSNWVCECTCGCVYDIDDISLD